MTRPTKYHSDDASSSSFHEADRGVSFTVSYVLTVAIAVVLVAGILITTGQTVQSQRESAVRDGAAVVADETAATIMAADRLVRTGNRSDGRKATAVVIELTLPDALANQPYTVSLELSDGSVSVVVASDVTNVVVDTPLANETSVRETTVSGGDVRVVYRPESEELALVDGDP